MENQVFVSEHQEAAGMLAKIKKVGRKILTYVPAAIIIGLIVLYYVQLSHVGG